MLRIRFTTGAALAALILTIIVAVTGALSPRSASAALEGGFSDELVAQIAQPTALAFTPDGRILIASQGGQLHVYEDDALFPVPAVDLGLGNRLCSTYERGLLGVAVDPNFADNYFIYLYYEFNKSGICPINAPTSADNPVSRVSRFTLSATNIVDLASEKVLIDNIPSPKGNHPGGDLQFVKDGYLYVSVGDGGCDYANNSGCQALNDAARDSHVLLGKILRITRNGGIPPTNPYQGPNSDRCDQTGRTQAGKNCQETFASGLRNPFRIAFDPNASATRFFINDVGQDLWEEIDRGQAGADYGWDVREGFCPKGVEARCAAAPPQFTDPIYAYKHAACGAVTGGAFVPDGQWPNAYDGAYLFGDYVCGQIFRLAREANGVYKRRDFATVPGARPGARNGVVHMAFGPHRGRQALYYTTFANGGQVRRISFTGSADRAPYAFVTASPRFGALPLNVGFDASQSNDPDGDPLTYEWVFGDGSPPAFGRTVSHTYAAQGIFHATLSVRDARGGQAQAIARIDPGHVASRVTVTSPSPDTRFRVGQPLTLRALAVDENNRPLPNGALSWTALLHHNAHTHPYISSQSGNGIVIPAPPPEDLAATAASYLELRLTATDARGLRTTVVRNVLPRRVPITFTTVPPGLRLTIDGKSAPTPRTVTSWDGYALTVLAPNQADAAGNQRTFQSWSNGGAQEHLLTTPPKPQTFRATFR